MKSKGIIAIILLAALLFSPSAFAVNPFSDIQGHWAQRQITTWQEAGLAAGYADGTFHPNNSVTRAEFFAWVNRAFALPAASTGAPFADVAAGAWFYHDVSSAVAAGIASGYPDGTFRPDNPITRQEAAAVLARQLNLPAAAGLAFTDSAAIGTWARSAVNAVSAAGIMAGYPDGTFGPARPITRAESVSMLDRGLAYEAITIPDTIVTFTEAGTYGPEIGRLTMNNVVIKAEGVTLRNCIITGTLTIAAEVGEGSVTLQNITVKGNTYIRGGGAESIHLIGGAYNNMIVEIVAGKVRIVAVDAAGIQIIIAEAAAGTEIILEGIFESVTVKGPDVNLVIQGAGSMVKTLTIEETATNTTVSGDGAIHTAIINATGAVIEQTPEKTTVRAGITARVGGKTVPAPADSWGVITIPPLQITDFSVANAIITELAAANTWSVSEQTALSSIGAVNVSFNQNIDKSGFDSFDIRAFDAAGNPLEFVSKDLTRILLHDRFSGGNANQLQGTLDSTYMTVYDAMQGAVLGTAPVRKLEFDIFNSTRTRTVMITLFVEPYL